MKIKITYKGIFRIFFLASLLFLIIHLINDDYIVWPKIINPLYLAFSLVILAIAVLLSVLGWSSLLSASKIKIPFSQSIESYGMAIFGKYIPGKFWLIGGMSASIADFSKKPIGTITTITIIYQALLVLSGIIVGLPYLSLFVNQWIMIVVILSAILFIFFMFSRLFNKFLQRILTKIKIHGDDLMNISLQKSYFPVSLSLLQWILYSVGFYFMIAGIYDKSFSLWVGFAFPLAATGGILVLIAPGGIGVREGILVAILTSVGFKLNESLTIAAFSRVWFLFGECFIFILALVLLVIRKNKAKAIHA